MEQYKLRECEKSQEYHRNMVIAWEQMMQPLRKKYEKELAAIKACERQFFCYEHPDMELRCR